MCIRDRCTDAPQAAGKRKTPETERTGAQEKLFYAAEDLRYCASNINHCRMRICERCNNSGHNNTDGADIDKMCIRDSGKLYSTQTAIEKALREKVWLKNGGYLVIQPTEALTVIDVNSGKNAGKGKNEEGIMKIDLEAAREAAKQIRLRNLSGIIIIDFINLESEENVSRLMREFRMLLAKDPIQTTLVDITPLNLVEVTRKKVHRPLHEQIENSRLQASGKAL